MVSWNCFNFLDMWKKNVSQQNFNCALGLLVSMFALLTFELVHALRPYGSQQLMLQANANGIMTFATCFIPANAFAVCNCSSLKTTQSTLL